MTIIQARKTFWVCFMSILVTSMIFIGINLADAKKKVSQNEKETKVSYVSEKDIKSKKKN